MAFKEICCDNIPLLRLAVIINTIKKYVYILTDFSFAKGLLHIHTHIVKLLQINKQSGSTCLIALGMSIWKNNQGFIRERNKMSTFFLKVSKNLII